MCRNQLKHPRRVSRHGTIKAFTLIEILVVVAIIALLVAILLPSLAGAREQARIALCSSNLHQQGLGMVTYGEDFNGQLPPRGWFSYHLAETYWEAYNQPDDTNKVLIGLGLLHGDDRKPQYTSYIGKEWDLLYCPNLIPDVRDMPPTIDAAGHYQGGLATRFDPAVRRTYAGYEYAYPVENRSCRFGEFGLGKKHVYTPKLLATRWIAAVGQSQGLPVTDDEDSANDYRYKIRLQAMQVVSMDRCIIESRLPHKNGVNALYSDGHVKFVKIKNERYSTFKLETPEMWLYVTTHP